MHPAGSRLLRHDLAAAAERLERVPRARGADMGADIDGDGERLVPFLVFIPIRGRALPTSQDAKKGFELGNVVAERF